MATYGTMKTRIATELDRSDLTTNIASAILDAIEFHENERFWFNEFRSITFSTVATQVAYAAAANAAIPYLVKIDQLMLVESTSTYPLDRYNPDEFDLIALGQSTSGKPTTYTYSESEIRLWPTPDAVYSMRLHGVKKLTALSADGDTNAWTTEAEQLIRRTAKIFLAIDVTENRDEMVILDPVIRQQLSRLAAETSSRTGSGMIRPTQF